MNFGFVNVAAAVPRLKVADVDFNTREIELLIEEAENNKVEIICFPELCITGYSCQDLFLNQLLLKKAEQSIIQLLDFTRKMDIITIVGMPVCVDNILYNCAVVFQKGTILGLVPKTHLPNYGEFYEKRWFGSSYNLRETKVYFAGSQITISPKPKVFVTFSGVKFGVEICEDLWAPVPPGNNLALAGADIIFNLSASNTVVGKMDYIKNMVSLQSSRLKSAYVYTSSGLGESSQDSVFAGSAVIYEDGVLLSETKRFSLDSEMTISEIDIEGLRHDRLANNSFREESFNANAEYIEAKPVDGNGGLALKRAVNPLPFVPASEELHSRCEEILNIQSCGLARRLKHIGCSKVVVGVSGGLDSTLALLVAIRAFKLLNIAPSGIIGITMPGFGTSGRTYRNAVRLMELLGVTSREISIADSVNQHFEDIGHNKEVHDVTYENSQARERTQILMDVANQESGIVIGTGDMSELALGWATYNGDHMSMYGVNAGVPKTTIRYVVRHEAENYKGEIGEILLDIIDTPISPELIPADDSGNITQKTEKIVGPYELHDFFLYYLLRYNFAPDKIFYLATRAFDGSDDAGLKYDNATIYYWLKVFFKRFISQQYKRSCLPDGPKVMGVSLSPRTDLKMPSDTSLEMWMKECDSISANFPEPQVM